MLCYRVRPTQISEIYIKNFDHYISFHSLLEFESVLIKEIVRKQRRNVIYSSVCVSVRVCQVRDGTLNYSSAIC